MNRENFEKVLKQVMFHAGVLLKGLARTLLGTLNAGLIAFAVYGFIYIPSESGYAAVLDFVVLCGILAFALVNVYWMGSKKRGGKK